ncbi:MAG: hypothetical protein NVSMB7_14120 [Chitinophagaceae bacterium]
MKKAIFFFLLLASSSVLCLQAAAQKQSTALNHIALYIYDLKKGTAFYQQIIGLDTIPEPFHDGKHTWFRIGEHSQLHLIQGATDITKHDKNTHLCFSTGGSMETFIAQLKKAGIPYENWKGEPQSITRRPDGVQQIYFQGPDRHWIEINDDKF